MWERIWIFAPHITDVSLRESGEDLPIVRVQTGVDTIQEVCLFQTLDGCCIFVVGVAQCHQEFELLDVVVQRCGRQQYELYAFGLLKHLDDPLRNPLVLVLHHAQILHLVHYDDAVGIKLPDSLVKCGLGQHLFQALDVTRKRDVSAERVIGVYDRFGVRQSGVRRAGALCCSLGWVVDLVFEVKFQRWGADDERGLFVHVHKRLGDANCGARLPDTRAMHNQDAIVLGVWRD